MFGWSGGQRDGKAVRPAAGAQEDLQPGIADRFRMALSSSPRWSRIPALRRLAAAVLVVAAAVLLVRGDPAAEPVDVLVASHDLAPGTVLDAQDLSLSPLPARAVPDGAVPGLAGAVGRVTAAPMRTGEPVTDVRMLGTPLARSAAGVEDARLVTIRLADPALAEVVRAGDLVDVIAAAQPDTGHGAAGQDTTPPGTTLATRAPVVLVPPADDARSRSGRVLLIALPARKAARVASASMTHAMTVTVH